MLPPFIIEQIRRREEVERRKREDSDQPRVEIPMDTHQPASDPDNKEDSNRGVVILDLGWRF